jgi:hypothetical protein
LYLVLQGIELNLKRIPRFGLDVVIPELRRLKQEDHEFKDSLGHVARSYLKTTTVAGK